MSASKREKNYLQHYRKKWEQIPQLRGWLSEAPSTNPEYAKAFCKYCQKKLVPHVTGLLKHASCRNHLKAAKEYVDKINAAVRRAQEKAQISSTPATDEASKNSTEEQTTAEEELNELLVIKPGNSAEPQQQDDSADNEGNELAEEMAEKDEDITENVDEHMETVTVIMDPISHTKRLKVLTNLGPLSTHVLDTIKGSPAIGLGVTLYKLKDSRWTMIAESVTDGDGRCNDLLSVESMTAGRYKMQYALSQYYTIRNQDCFYPVVELTIDLADPNHKYNVPLLISPFSYSTYKA